MSLAQAISDIHDALVPLQAQIAGLQVSELWEDTPTPPCIDVYPGTPFQDGASLTAGDNRIYMTVRARVAMADAAAGQTLLLRMLDPADPASVEMALAGADWAVVPDGVTGYTSYSDDLPASQRMLGCEWRISRFL